MKTLITVSILLSLAACKHSSTVNFEAEKKSKEDSMNTSMIERAIDSMNFEDSHEGKMRKERKYLGFDTVGVYNAPIKILSAEFFETEYSSYKGVRLVYKNVSNKDVAGIKFSFMGANVFNELADMGASLNGIGGGFTQELLKAGQTRISEWDNNSKDGKNITLAWPFKVVFTDGTTWKSSY